MDEFARDKVTVADARQISWLTLSFEDASRENGGAAGGLSLMCIAASDGKPVTSLAGAGSSAEGFSPSSLVVSRMVCRPEKSEIWRGGWISDWVSPAGTSVVRLGEPDAVDALSGIIPWGSPSQVSGSFALGAATVCTGPHACV